MTLTRKLFRRVILLSFITTIVFVAIEFLPFFTNYELLEEQLHPGYISEDLFFVLFIMLFLGWLLSLILLYLFKPISRIMYMISILGIIILSMFTGDMIFYAITYPLSWFESFLDIFIMYLIYLTPLKKEFKNK